MRLGSADLLRSHLGSSPNQDSHDLNPFSPLHLFYICLGALFFTDVTAAAQTLDCCSQDDLKEGDHQTGDQPDVDHLHVRCGGQLLYLAGEDGCHHQHDGQVHGNGVAKEVFVEEDGGEGDEEQEDGGEVGGHQLCDYLPLEFYGHGHHVSVPLFGQGQVCYCEHGQVLVFIRQIFETLWLT